MECLTNLHVVDASQKRQLTYLPWNLTLSMVFDTQDEARGDGTDGRNPAWDRLYNYMNCLAVSQLSTVSTSLTYPCQHLKHIGISRLAIHLRYQQSAHWICLSAQQPYIFLRTPIFSPREDEHQNTEVLSFLFFLGGGFKPFQCCESKWKSSPDTNLWWGIRTMGTKSLRCIYFSWPFMLSAPHPCLSTKYAYSWFGVPWSHRIEWQRPSPSLPSLHLDSMNGWVRESQQCVTSNTNWMIRIS